MKHFIIHAYLPYGIDPFVGEAMVSIGAGPDAMENGICAALDHIAEAHNAESTHKILWTELVFTIQAAFSATHPPTQVQLSGWSA